MQRARVSISGCRSCSVPPNEVSWQPDSQIFIDKLIGKVSPNSKGGSNFIINLFKEIGVLFGNVFRGLFGTDLVVPEGSAEEVKEEFNINKLTPGEQDQVKAIYDNMSKVAFKTSIRMVYLGRRENFNKALGVAGVMGALKQFSDVNLNALYPDPRSKTFANYYFTEPRLNYRQRKVVQDYRFRSSSLGTFIFNTEELGFHFPLPGHVSHGTDNSKN